MFLCGWWEGDGAFHKSSWTHRKASNSSCCTNTENYFSQFSFSLYESEIEVWVEIWIRSLQYLSTQLMAAPYSSSSNSPIWKRFFLENNSYFLWKRPSAWFSLNLSTQSSSTKKSECTSCACVWKVFNGCKLNPCGFPHAKTMSVTIKNLLQKLNSSSSTFFTSKVSLSTESIDQ